MALAAIARFRVIGVERRRGTRVGRSGIGTGVHPEVDRRFMAALAGQSRHGQMVDARAAQVMKLVVEWQPSHGSGAYRPGCGWPASRLPPHVVAAGAVAVTLAKFLVTPW